MTKKIKDLKTIDISFHNSIDGFWDIGVGLAFLLAGFSFLFDIVAYTAAFYFPVFLLIKGFKNRITYPRIGYVNHKGMDKTKSKTLLILLLLGLLLFILGVFVFFKLTKGTDNAIIYSSIKSIAPIFFGLVISLIVFSLGKAYKITRFYYYSIIILVSFIAMKFISIANILPIVLLTCGTIILLVGLITLIRFIHNYPVLENENYDEE